jgi:hypothetical protein
MSIRHSLDLPVTGYLPPGELTAAEKLQEEDDEAATGGPLFGEFGGDRFVPTAVREACEEDVDPWARSSKGSPKLTVNCLCARVGPARCAESLFRAYLYGHGDVIQSLWRITAGKLEGPAVTFCRALGMKRCLMRINAAKASPERSDARSVAFLWEALHGEHPSAPFDQEQAQARLTELADVRLLAKAATAPPPPVGQGEEDKTTSLNASALATRLAGRASPTRFGDHAGLRDLADVVRSIRQHHYISSRHVPLEVATWASRHNRVDETLDSAAVKLGAVSALPIGGASMVRHAELFHWAFDDGTNGTDAPAASGKPPSSQPDSEYEASSIFEYLAKAANGLRDATNHSAGRPEAPEAPAPSPPPETPLEAAVAGKRPVVPPLPRTVLPADLEHADIQGDGIKAAPPPEVAAAVAENKAWDAKRKKIEGVCGPTTWVYDELTCLDEEGACTLTKDSLLPAKQRPRRGASEDGPLIESRSECEAAVDAMSGQRGQWSFGNTFVPLPYPGAFAAVVKSGLFKPVADLLEGGVASATMLLHRAPRAVTQLPEIHPACVATLPSYGSGFLGSPSLSPEIAWNPEVVAAALGSTPSSPPPDGLMIPYDLRSAVVAQAGSLSSVWHVKQHATLSPSLPDGAVTIVPPKKLSEVATKKVGTGASARALYAVPAALFCPNTVHRPIDLASRIQSPDVVNGLLAAGGDAFSSFASRIVAFQWRQMRLNNISHPGLHGVMMVANTHWNCLPRTLDFGGCVAEGGSPFSDPGDALCDPVSREGCICFSPEPPESPLMCDDSDGPPKRLKPRRKKKKRRKTTSTTTTTRNKNTNSRKTEAKLKEKQGKEKKPKKCDPNPFT